MSYRKMLYRKIYKKLRTVVVYRRQDDLSRVEEIRRLTRRLDVQKHIENPSGKFCAIKNELEGFDAVIVIGVNSSLRNGIAKYCIHNDVRCFVAPHVGDIIMQGARHISSIRVPIFSIRRAFKNPFYLMAKRTFDIIVSIIAIVLLSPVYLITSLVIKLYDLGPVFYKQVRLTKDGKKFNVLKFRSMRVDAEKDGVARLAAENDDRITPIGHFIRAVRIDELPQLINILKGEMSIVGPRPERPEIAADYEKEFPEFALRLQAKAGLTGYAQVYGKYNTTPNDKLLMDLQYIANPSLAEDLKIMFATVKILFMPESTEGVEVGSTTALGSGDFSGSGAEEVNPGPDDPDREGV